MTEPNPLRARVIVPCSHCGVGLRVQRDGELHRDPGRVCGPCRERRRLESLLRRVVEDRCGFLDRVDLAELVELDRLRQVLVRWHQGRAVVAAQDARPIIEATEIGGWCVRDVSLPSTDYAHRVYEYGRGVRKPSGN